MPDDLPEHDVFFPKAPSSEEGGARRGCVVLTSAGSVTDRVAQLASLRRL